MTDTDALKERIRRARSVPAEWARLREGESTREQIERHHRRMDEQTAALVAEEVRKAKAEALDEFIRFAERHEHDALTRNASDDEVYRWATVFTTAWYYRVAEYETGDQR